MDGRAVPLLPSVRRGLVTLWGVEVFGTERDGVRAVIAPLPLSSLLFVAVTSPRWLALGAGSSSRLNGPTAFASSVTPVMEIRNDKAESSKAIGCSCRCRAGLSTQGKEQVRPSKEAAREQDREALSDFCSTIDRLQSRHACAELVQSARLGAVRVPQRPCEHIATSARLISDPSHNCGRWPCVAVRNMHARRLRLSRLRAAAAMGVKYIIPNAWGGSATRLRAVPRSTRLLREVLEIANGD